jgi:toxin ParE1/3/4
MAYQVVWSLRALDDVDEIAAYIARDSPAYAGALIGKILETTRALTNFPLAGRIVPEFGDETLREKLVYSYRIIDRVENQIVTIAAIIHGKRIV